MNNNIKIIASAMLFILFVVLIVIFCSYLGSRNVSDEKTVEKDSHISGEHPKENKNEEIIESDSGESTIVSGDTEILELHVSSGENETDNIKIEEPIIGNSESNQSILPNTIVEIKKEEPKEPVISSNVDTSNEEKRQVLNELDTALQGLLEAVGKVPTVNEEKLDASLKEGEVVVSP